jgi:hypothetical protein
LLATLPARTRLPEGLVAGLQRLLAMGKLGWAVEAALDGWILTRLTRGPIMRGGRPVAVFLLEAVGADDVRQLAGIVEQQLLVI